MPDTDSLQVIPKGVCIKTCFHREGPYLHCVATLVSGGDVQIFKASVDLRPIYQAVSAAHFRMHGDNSLKVGGFFSSIASVVKATGVTKLVKAVSNEVSKVAKIPVVGPLLAASTSVMTHPLAVVSDLAKGGRIDTVVLNNLKKQIGNAKTIAPYAQTVMSFVPGVGTGLSAAIGAASALASGQRIDDALLAGVRGAVPGGPVAQAAFDVAAGVAQGKPIDQIALNALPIAPAQKEALVQALKLTKDIAAGKKVDQALLDRASAVVSGPLLKAVQTGAAMGLAKSLQDATKLAKGVVLTPPIGAPAMAAFSMAKDVISTIESANKVAAQVKKAAAPGAPPALKAAAQRNIPAIQNLMQRKAAVQKQMATLADKAKRGDKEALAAQKVFGTVIAQHQALKSRVSNVASTTGFPANLITKAGKIVPANVVETGARKAVNGALAFDGKKVLPGNYKVAGDRFDDFAGGPDFIAADFIDGDRSFKRSGQKRSFGYETNPVLSSSRG